MWRTRLCGVVMVAVLVTGVTSESDSDIIAKLLENYDQNEAPEQPTSVEVSIYFSTLAILDANHEMKSRLYLRQTWNDSRLAYTQKDTDINIPQNYASQIWTPDTYFFNAISVEQTSIPVNQQLLRLKPNGKMWKSATYTVTSECGAHLSKYPMDTHKCSIKIESYTRKSKEQILKIMKDSKPLQLADNMQMGIWTLEDSGYSNCSKEYSTGGYPCLSFDLTFRRDSGHALRHAYAPLILLLIVNYASFFLGRKQSQIRFGYLFLIALLMCSATISANMSLDHPKVGYILNFDVWIGMCFALYFSSVLHFLVIHRLNTKGSSQDKTGPHAGKAKMFDRVGLIGYPIVLILWLIIYFSLYMS